MRTARLVVVLCASWLYVQAGSASAQKPEPTKQEIARAKKHYAQAREHQERKEYQKAAEQYLEAYALYPDAEFLFNVGEVYRLKGDKRKAVEYFEKYLELEPRGRGSGNARESIAKLKPEIEAEDAAAAKKKAEEDVAAKKKAEEDAAAKKKAGEEEADPDTVTPTDAPKAYPAEWVMRPIQLLEGQVEAGATVNVYTGPDNDWDAAFASWIGFVPRVRYGITDKVQAGGRILLLPIKSDSSDFEQSAFFGGITATGKYALHEAVSAALTMGFAVRGRLGRTPYLVPWSMPPLFDDRTFGVAVGASLKKEFAQRVAVSADPRLVFQLDSVKDHEKGCDPSDAGCITASALLHFPVAVHFQAIPVLAVGLRTGIYTGPYDFSFDPDKGASYPLVVEALVTLAGGKLDLGASAGLANISGDYKLDGEHDTAEPGETFYLGVSAAWRNR